MLLPGVSVPARLVAQVRDRAAGRLWKALARAPGPEQRTRLEALVIVPERGRQTALDRLRRAPDRVSGPALVAALERFAEIRSLDVGRLDLRHVPASRIDALARYAGSARTATNARMPSDRRIATVLAFVRVFEATALDDALDVLDALIIELSLQARRAGRQERLCTLHDLDTAALQLREACAVLLDDACGDGRLRATIVARVSRECLAEVVARVGTLARPPGYGDHAEREDIAPGVDVARSAPKELRLLDCHVRQRTAHQARRAAYAELEVGRQVEIEQHGLAVVAKQDVGGLEVPVQDASLVGVRQSVREPEAQPKDGVDVI